MESLLRVIKKVVPQSLFKKLQPVYHYIFSLLGALLYRFPSKEIYIIGITGTKGKSSTSEILNAILEGAGIKTALVSTIRFKIGEKSEKNLFKMTMPGRFFIQKFIRKAVDAKCTHLIIEMTSEGAKQFRHKYIDLNALIFTNLSPEHIESHGSFEAYLAAKLKLRDALANSKKKNKIIVANMDDKYGAVFQNANIDNKIGYTLENISEIVTVPNISFIYRGKKYTSPLQGEFNVSNILGALTFCENIGVPIETTIEALKNFSNIPGRVDYVEAGQNFKVIVDYAHTTDSLTKLYKTFDGKHKVCVLGNTGGGRDTKKRPEMAAVAEKYCDKIILTDEDPYDEDPKKIIDEMVSGMKNSP